MTHHKVIIGDARDMREVKDESVHLIVTSPPYWQLKDYGIENQIGFNHSYEEYINHLNLVWQECYRVLHKGCRLCINIGDQFARSVYYGRYKIIPIHSEIIRFCEAIGFDYMGSIIWQKPTTMNTSGGASVMGSFPYPRNGIVKIDFEYILIFKKQGEAPKVSKEIKEQSKLSKEEWNEYFNGHWNFNGEKQQAHLAMFPLELPKRLIKMFSFIGDTVLDPFLGSGTTALAALQFSRNSIGYEINPEFLEVIKKKLPINDLLTKPQLEIVYSTNRSINFSERIRQLPYTFKDPTVFDKKVDPKKINFGSKISLNESNFTDYFSVKEIIEPNVLILNNGLKVKLIGIKPIPSEKENAIHYIKIKTQRQKVFLKFDKEKYDSEGNLLCYLYLKNKTFINAHLIKQKLVDVDWSGNYSYKEKFIKLVQAEKING